MRQNDILDRKIQNLNFDIQEQSLTKDILFGEKEQERRNERYLQIERRFFCNNSPTYTRLTILEWKQLWNELDWCVKCSSSMVKYLSIALCWNCNAFAHIQR